MEDGKKAIITVLGHDRVGIIYNVSGILAGTNVNILDISQTIMQGFFTMIMVVDVSGCTVSFNELKDMLEEKARELNGLQINIQHEDIFNFMHRI